MDHPCKIINCLIISAKYGGILFHLNIHIVYQVQNVLFKCCYIDGSVLLNLSSLYRGYIFCLFKEYFCDGTNRMPPIAGVLTS